MGLGVSGSSWPYPILRTLTSQAPPPMPRTRRKSETTNHERIKYIEPATEFGTIPLPFSKNGPHLQVFMQLNLLK